MDGVRSRLKRVRQALQHRFHQCAGTRSAVRCRGRRPAAAVDGRLHLSLVVMLPTPNGRARFPFRASRGMKFGVCRRAMNSSTVKRYLPWVVAATMFMEQLDSTILNTAVPSMAVSLHVTPLSLKSVVTSYIISLAVCIPISGWMADPFGSRRVFASAVATFP